MADTFTSTNYNGELNEFLYKVLGLGAQTAQKGGYHLIPGVNYKEELDYLETDEDPMTDYTDDTPTLNVQNTVLTPRDIAPEKFTVWGTITPSVWLPIWKKYRSIGTLTQLNANPQFLQDVFALVGNATARQLDKLFWQGDKAAGAGSPLRFLDGIMKKIEADSNTNVVFVTPAGAITQANVVDRLEDMYAAMLDKFLEDPDFKIHMNTGDFKLLQQFNNDAKKTTVGVLSQNVERLFLEQRIDHFTNLPASHMVGAKTMSAEQSNFVMAMYASLEDEMMGIKVEKKELSNITRYRFDGMADAQYRFGGDITYYKPV